MTITSVFEEKSEIKFGCTSYHKETWNIQKNLNSTTEDSQSVVTETVQWFNINTYKNIIVNLNYQIIINILIKTT